jgi:hypothetical protein
MALNEDPSPAQKNQGVPLWATGQRRTRRPRSRGCLLKGCERRFRPSHPLTRYCSEECRDQARRWREWKARHRYRQTEGGKQKRRAQGHRYRLRRKTAREAHREPGQAREGHRKKNYLAAPAIGLGAMRSSGAAGARRCSDFVRTRVGGLWSGSWSENGAGGNGSRSGTGVSGPSCGARTGRGRTSGDGPEILRFLR